METWGLEKKWYQDNRESQVGDYRGKSYMKRIQNDSGIIHHIRPGWTRH